MRKEVEALAGDIATSLLDELRKRTAEDAFEFTHSAETGASEMPGDDIASTGPGGCAQTAKLLSVESTTPRNQSDSIAQRISSLEARLDALVQKLDDPSQRKEASGLPNGKHSTTNQRDVASLLDYVESRNLGGRTKLVIMNFND